MGVGCSLVGGGVLGLPRLPLPRLGVKMLSVGPASVRATRRPRRPCVNVGVAAGSRREIRPVPAAERRSGGR